MTLLGLTLTQDSEFQPVPVITGPRSKIGLIDNQREGWYNVKPDRIGGRYKYADRVERLCIIGV